MPICSIPAEDRKYQVLRQYFGYTSFRGGQEELIDAQLAGRDVLGIMPTGGGKSLCYQIPALLSEGITLVISPLISLMKDQVMALKKAGIPAAFINTSLTPNQIRLVYQNMRAGKYKMIYVAPERLMTEGFLDTVRRLHISLLAVDEAHCISQWGQDFRPSYLRIAEFLRQLSVRPVVSAFTATATAQVRDDIRQMLELRDPLRVVTGFDRPNLRFEVLRPQNKPAAIRELVQDRRDKSGIIYCATRKTVEKVCALLQEHGIAATRYHAGLPEEERKTNQEDFIYDRRPVMVATNAFGMGIDKSNVAYVIHYNMPQSMEAYYQEAGRAGRDGAAAECILMYSAGDIRTAQFLIRQSDDGGELSPEQLQLRIQQDMARLEQIIGYCTAKTCLRGYILSYFGEPHPEKCGNCGRCDLETMDTEDITLQARMILSCVKRIHSLLGYGLGIVGVVRVLRGSRDSKLLAVGVDRLSTYGLMQDTPRDRLRAMVSSLTEQGYLDDDAHGGLRLGDRAHGVLFGGDTVTMPVRRLPETAAAAKPAPSTTSSPASGELYDALRALRMKLAARERVPAYIIFPNATLQDMAAKAPSTMEELRNVSGVGSYKAEQYGEAFLAEIRAFRQAQEAGDES